VTELRNTEDGLRNLADLSLSELEDMAEDLTGRKFAGRQLFGWINRHHEIDFKEMNNLAKNFRADLVQTARVETPEVLDVQVSHVDGTRKFLFGLSDGLAVESVWIPGKYNTICVSSQVGCPLACRFCYTGTMKSRRDLTPGEIAWQVYAVHDHVEKIGESFQNIVFMGMGEPFLNYDAVLDGIELVCNHLGMGIAHKRITISTVGIVPGMFRLADSGSKVRLAVSLHSADDEKRTELMPVNKKYPLHELAEAMRYYAGKTGQRITIEYCMIGGVNDGLLDAKKLVSFIHDIPCKINLIRFNPSDGLPAEYKSPTEDSIQTFMDYLYPRCPAVTVRKSKGVDIQAACGQLATQNTPPQKLVD